MINIEKLLPFLGNIDEDGRYIKIVKFVIKNILITYCKTVR